ncbi:thiamine phosphate synthase [Niveibacterium sp. 24ML]|uniref:thiamine phosphate synthase n=1 Tax=Niveibacterium sp. 24ML TaxID=2985512 RepID=UPI00226E87CC|nr:thiamine phosphate synthase [Niveibacterium sp. 24ML]MCX9155796.1 thiamine phosphate synthase [Niveibacterium sp. 24ML]
MTRLRRGLYAITPDWRDTARLLAVTESILTGGAVLLQYRNKMADAALAHAQASALLGLCRRYEVPLLINDDVALATDIGADGAHIGRDDGELAAARARLGAKAIIGVSCYADLNRARDAAMGGADYVAFGAMFASPTKPHAPPAPMSLLGAARAFGKPVTCIGGITAENAGALVTAGADLLAVISDLYEAAEPRERAATYAALFAGH